MWYLEPALPVLLLLGLIGLIRAWRRSSAGQRPWLLTVSIVGLTLLSLTPAAWLFSRPLEIWYDQIPAPSASADAIVVLAGGLNRPTPDRPYVSAGTDTSVRVQHAAWLFKRWGGSRPVLACGPIRGFLESEGIPAEMIWMEARGKTTHEESFYCSEFLRRHGISRIALVTEASSMVRAAACFRKQGATVVPAPSGFFNLNHTLEDILPEWQAIQQNGLIVHEFVGLLSYWFHGWI
jgi:uncharacterized SAM-binding protein YcdF (DUF218 family)